MFSSQTLAEPSDPTRLQHLEQLSIEEIFAIEVTSVSKKKQDLGQAAAAVFVLTQEDIRRSGMTSIPELLRLVPGLQVARMGSHRYAITSRGFNSQFSNKLLVLIDGRSVYTPNFSGVWWDSQDVVLEDVERIEVIRGPGGTTWGANAVNGVINIISKDSADTQGVLVSAGYGTHEGLATIRYGGSIGDDLHYRAYAKGNDRENFAKGTNPRGVDDWSTYRGGFRTDWKASPKDKLTFQGDVYRGNLHDRFTYFNDFTGVARTRTLRNKLEGFNLLGRWTHASSDDSEFVLQFYFDRADRELILFTSTDETDTYDIDFTHRFAWGERQEIQWGGGWRNVRTDLASTFQVAYDNEHRSDHIFSAFLQDEIVLIPEWMTFTAGTKVERNNYTDWEVQPSVRLSVTPTEKHTFWASASRSVRTPARSAEDLDMIISVTPGAPPTTVRIRGNDDFESERAYVYELGYRGICGEAFSVDFAYYYSDFDDIQNFEPLNGVPLSGVFEGPDFVIPMFFENTVSGYSAGAELSLQWQPHENLRLIANYTYHRTNLSFRDAANPESIFAEGQNPNHQASLRAQLDLPWNLELDTALFYVENLHVSDPSTRIDIPSYVRWDLRLGWRPTENWDVSIFGENLTDGRHREYVDGFGFGATHVPRAFHAKLTYRY